MNLSHLSVTFQMKDPSKQQTSQAKMSGWQMEEGGRGELIVVQVNVQQLFHLPAVYLEVRGRQIAVIYGRNNALGFLIVR